MKLLIQKAINISKVVLISAIGFSMFLTSCTESTKVEEQSLSEGWQIISSADITADGKALTSSESATGNWINAKVPTTVLGALVEADVYKDPFYAKNLADIPRAPFENPWWFRTEFSIDDFNANKEQLRLFIDGINYRANFWLNGVQIASQDTVYGAFKQFEIDITKVAQTSNILAVEIIPPEVRDFYMGFVDWAPTPPDHYMGIYREVRLKRTGKAALDAPFVKTDVDLKTLKSADISFSGEVTNFSDKPKTVTVTGTIENIKVSKEVNLKANEKATIWFKPSEFEQLKVQNPRLWWSNGLGNPDMYVLNLQIQENGTLVDEQNVNFGIRTIETYLNETDQRGYKVNGRKVMQKSGGWVDDLFLRYMPEKDAAQIRYVKEMNMNSVRFEGFWGNSQHIYDLCDQNGILVMVGWSCQWEWPDYLGLPMDVSDDDPTQTIAEGVEENGVKITAEEEVLLSDYLRDQVKWLRNHPSIFCWAVGSDAMPKPSLEKRYHETLNQFDNTRSLLLSAGEFTSEISGPSGMKMFGPYEYVPPVYWFEDDSKYGGAYGYNSETGPGPQIPPIESIKKMIPEEQLWPPANDMWNYHSGRKDFNSVTVYLEALNNKYGEPKDLEELALKAQIMNYEAMRPMFEAHVINRKEKATGVVQWMLNSPWPEFYWQLYDYYLMPNGAYYGTQKAGQPSTLIYNYHEHKVYASNDQQNAIQDYQAQITLYDINSKVVFETTEKISLGENEYKSLIDVPALQGNNKVYFLDMKLKNASGDLVSDNFYWLATKTDEMAWEKYVWFYTPQKQYADFNEINTMEKVEILATKEVVSQGDEWEVNVTVSNPSDKLAFFLELNAVKKSDGKSILPVFWNDNYISLAPGESKALNLKFYQKDLGEDEPEIVIQGINIDGKLKI